MEAEADHCDVEEKETDVKEEEDATYCIETFEPVGYCKFVSDSDSLKYEQIYLTVRLNGMLRDRGGRVSNDRWDERIRRVLKLTCIQDISNTASGHGHSKPRPGKMPNSTTKSYPCLLIDLGLCIRILALILTPSLSINFSLSLIIVFPHAPARCISLFGFICALRLVVMARPQTARCAVFVHSLVLLGRRWKQRTCTVAFLVVVVGKCILEGVPEFWERRVLRFVVAPAHALGGAVVGVYRCARRRRVVSIIVAGIVTVVHCSC